MTDLPPAGVPVAKKSHRGRNVLIGVVVLVVLAVGGFLVARPSPSSSATGPTTRPTAAPVDGGPRLATTTEATTTPVADLTTAPNLVGKSLSDAENTLPTSVHLTTVNTVDTQHADGTVIAQDPQPGASLNGAMTVTVARQPITVYLDSMPQATGEWASDLHTASLGGKTYTDSVGGRLDACSSSQIVEYNLSKGYRTLVATAGIDDGGGDSSLKVQLQVFADGRIVFNQTIAFGAPIPLSIDVTGVLRLKIQFAPIQSQSCDYRDTFALGTAELFGLPGEVPASATDGATPTG